MMGTVIHAHGKHLLIWVLLLFLMLGAVVAFVPVVTCPYCDQAILPPETIAPGAEAGAGSA